MHKKQKRIFIQSTRPSTSLIDSFGLIKSREASGTQAQAQTITTLWQQQAALNDIEPNCIRIGMFDIKG